MDSTSFAYQAQTLEGQPLSGTIDAQNIEEAQRLLLGLRVRLIQIEPAAPAPRPKPLRGEDFLAFNQQLTQLTAAGLPVEHGLRLIAQDMRSGRLAATVKLVAAELEKGTPLGEAFDHHKDKFPPLYGRLVTAGVRANNLPGMLLNLGRHVDLVNRLRGTLWRAIAYPAFVIVSLGIVLIFLARVVIPQFEGMYRNFGVKLPLITEWMLALPGYTSWLIAILALIFLGLPLLWLSARWTGTDRKFLDLFILPLPLIGPVLARNLIARWCDGVRLGVQSGMDLPESIRLADEAVGSPRLSRDGERLIATLTTGKPLEQTPLLRMLPATVTAALGLAGSAHTDVPAVLGTLSDMYQQQAETRLIMIPATLTPILIVLVAIVIGVIVLAMFLPFLNLINALM